MTKQENKATEEAAKPEAAQKAKKSGRYVAQWIVKHNGVRHEAGAEIELTAEQAAQLGEAVKPAE